MSLGALDRFDMYGTFFKGLLEKNHLLSCLVSFANLLIGDQLVDIVDVDEGVKGSDMPRRVRHVCVLSISKDSELLKIKHV